MMVGVWVGPFRAAPLAPEALPMGRAALRLEAEGLPVVFGHEAHDGELVGLRAVPGGWRAHTGPVAAIYDRFPSRTWPEVYGALVANLPGVPRGNPPDVVGLCADKLACQRALELDQPDVEDDPEQFVERLRQWGAGFLKPRFGAFGVGVSRVQAGDPLSAEVMGPQGALEAALLQRAVPPPAGFEGVACRVLVQRAAEGWWADVPVARSSRTDAVVNAARGADVVTLAALFPDAVDAVRAIALQVAAQLAAGPSGRWVVELGVDVVLDAERRPWVIEVNGRPRGRLESLLPHAPEWFDAHVEACARPIRHLARIAR